MIRVEMPYIGSCLSVNHCYVNVRGQLPGRSVRVLRAETKGWMEILASQVRTAWGSQVVHLPVQVKVDGYFKNRRSMLDGDNLGKVICDSVAAGLGINDKAVRYSVGAWEVGEADPHLVIEVG